MSIVSDTYKTINLNKIPGKLVIYEQMIQEAEGAFEITGRILEDVLKDHSRNLMFYNITLQECKTIEDVIKLRIEEVEGELYKNFNENSSISLSTSDIKSYIKGDKKYVGIVTILLEVSDIRRKLEAIVGALESMGWSLSHITKLRVALLEKEVL